MPGSNRSQIGRLVRMLVYLGLGLYFLLLPGIGLLFDLNDPALKSGAIPRAAWRMHETLAPRYAAWANSRLESTRAEELTSRAAQASDVDVAGTEWPLFGSVFYLWSEEGLQKAWEADHSLASVAPAVYARKAIDAAAMLVTDPGQAAWVKRYWGDDYLHHHDLFYRFLLISAMTSYSNLTADPRYLVRLRDQVDSLSAEIDASPCGLLEDYPGQCFPTDVIGAIAAIRRADVVLKTDHSAFVKRAIRAYLPPRADTHGLPHYMASWKTGSSWETTRGCGDSFALICVPEIWPATAPDWYRKYVDNFWQERDGLVGFREYPKDGPSEMLSGDVDSGPIILGYGFAASAFGVGAARANGRMDEAAPLTAEMLVSSWPLPGGTLLVPRLLSKAADAPYLGEAGILYCLTRQPVDGVKVTAGSVMTPFVWLVMVIYLGFGFLMAMPLLQYLREKYRR